MEVKHGNADPEPRTEPSVALSDIGLARLFNPARIADIGEYRIIEYPSILKYPEVIGRF